MEKIVIIGSGIAGVTAAETIKENSPNTPVLIISDEEYSPYIRMKLSKGLGSNFSIEGIYIKDPEWYSYNKIGFIKGDRVTNIDSQNKILETENGLKIDYTKLILANGSSPFMPSIENSNIRGVYNVRKFSDVKNINEYIKANSVKNVAIIGGGLLGIEAAWSLVSNNAYLNVNIIQHSDRILSRQVDLEGGRILEDIMNKNNITVYNNADTSSLIGEERVKGIRFKDGREVSSELVIVSAGVRSNKQIADLAGIDTGRGIIVNEYMETSFKDIYAVGDVAEYNGKVLGLWPIAYEQGKIAGFNSIGVKQSYKEVSPSSVLMVMNTSVFSVGDISSENKCLLYSEGLYTKLFFKDSIIVGAVLMNNPTKISFIKDAINSKRSFEKELANGENIYNLL